jgi:ketosteroid isomerase-like protein
VKTKALLVAGLIGLTASPGSVRAAVPAQPAAEEQLTKIEDDWSESYVKRDASFAQQIIVEDFAFVGPDGNVVNKSDYVKSIPGPTVFTAFNIENLSVRVYGDAPVVTGTATISAKTGSKEESGRYAFIDSFVKQNGEWKAVSGQATAIAKH